MQHMRARGCVCMCVYINTFANACARSFMIHEYIFIQIPIHRTARVAQRSRIQQQKSTYVSRRARDRAYISTGASGGAVPVFSPTAPFVTICTRGSIQPSDRAVPRYVGLPWRHTRCRRQRRSKSVRSTSLRRAYRQILFSRDYSTRAIQMICHEKSSISVQVNEFIILLF